MSKQDPTLAECVSAAHDAGCRIDIDFREKPKEVALEWNGRWNVKSSEGVRLEEHYRRVANCQAALIAALEMELDRERLLRKTAELQVNAMADQVTELEMAAADTKPAPRKRARKAKA